MPDIESYKDVTSLYEARRKTRDVEIAQYAVVDSAIRGVWPKEYEGLFSSTDVPIQLRTLRSASDSLTASLSQIPIIPRVDVKGKRDSQTARDKAELVEKITRSWYSNSGRRGGTEFDGVTTQLARFQVNYGDAVMLVNPDLDAKMVFLEALHPRFFYPPAGWHPHSHAPLDGALLVLEMTLGEVKQRFAGDNADLRMKLSNAFQPPSVGYGQSKPQVDDTRMVKVGIYRHSKKWLAVAMGDKNQDVVLTESNEGDRNHPGVCGVVSFKQFGTDPLLIGQIGLEAGLVKVMNQQIQNTERINKAPIVGPPLMGDKLRWGEYNVVDLGLLGNRTFIPQRLAPDSPNNLTQVMGSFLALSERFNYNPESNQGQGDANSGKAIQQLQAGPRNLITNILFPPYKPAFARAHDACLEMELNLWPNEKRSAHVLDGKKSYDIDYRPSSDLAGYKGCIKIEGPQMGGYNAFLEAGQKKDMGLISEESVMEADPDILDVETERRRISLERNNRFIAAGFEALAGNDPLTAIKVGVELSKRIAEGKSEAVARAEIVAEGMLEPPPPPEPEMAAPGGLPPELAAMMGGAGDVPPPSLAEARGY